MKTSSSTTLQKVIEIGKQWMNTSQDLEHDTNHALRVEKIGLEIYWELVLEQMPGIDDILPEHVQIVAWWHDCYKASLGRKSLKDTVRGMFIEGRESQKIFTSQMNDFLTKDELRMIGTAIRSHAGFFEVMNYLLFGRAPSLFTKILLDADSWDGLTPERYTRCYFHSKKNPTRFLIFIDIILSMGIPLYLNFHATRKDVYKRLWNFLGVWFWNDWAIFRMWKVNE